MVWRGAVVGLGDSVDMGKNKKRKKMCDKEFDK
jgi:hypothetical protein